jgi:osmotically-inducible protein OsmY
MRQRVALLIIVASAVIAVACGQSDPGITTAIKAKLAQDDTLKAYQIDVDTSNRVVTLSGTVETGAAKAHAAMLARNTAGVRDVVDQITIDRQVAATTGREAGRDRAREAGDAPGDSTAGTGRTADPIRAVAPDAVITAAVKGKLLADTTVAGLKIDVDTDAGVVTLNGSATTRAEADRAVLLARTTDGVKRVVDNIKVGG